MSTDHKPNAPMTDEERLELAAKLDRDLDDFINSLEKTKYTDGWTEDNWQEEMDKHPFFRKTAPEAGEKLDPLMEGLQKLKYDPEENTAEELAIHYKEDGNFYMKHKKFRMAILGYTEGLKAKSGNAEVDSALLNNRSAAQFFLKNYRSSLFDAKHCLQVKPDYTKAKIRAAQCCKELKKYGDCVEFCDEILHENPDNKVILELRQSCIATKTIEERNARKLVLAERRKKEKLQNLLKELKKREIKFEGTNEADENSIQPHVAPLADFPVSIDANGNLVWPTIFCYPEFLTTDFHQQLHENVVFYDLLMETFTEHLESDKAYKYQPDNINVFYENRIMGTVHKISTKKTVKEIVNEKWFFIIDGTLMFYILPKNSEAETSFINQKRQKK